MESRTEGGVLNHPPSLARVSSCFQRGSIDRNKVGKTRRVFGTRKAPNIVDRPWLSFVQIKTKWGRVMLGTPARTSTTPEVTVRCAGSAHEVPNRGVKSFKKPAQDRRFYGRDGWYPLRSGRAILISPHFLGLSYMGHGELIGV